MMARRRWIVPLVAMLAGLPGVAAASMACPQVSHAPLAAPRLAAALQRGEEARIVAFGSSSTVGAGASEARYAYPAHLEQVLRGAAPGRRITVLNRGMGGEDVVQMLGRIEAEILPLSPDLVVWQLGANAALHGLDPATFGRLLREGLHRFRAAGVDVVLMDNQRAPRIAARPGHGAYDRILAAAAAEIPGVTLLSRGALMDGWAGQGVPNAQLLVGDGLHHNDRGYACIAEALAAALLAGLPSQAGR